MIASVVKVIVLSMPLWIQTWAGYTSSQNLSSFFI